MLLRLKGQRSNVIVSQRAEIYCYCVSEGRDLMLLCLRGQRSNVIASQRAEI